MSGQSTHASAVKSVVLKGLGTFDKVEIIEWPVSNKCGSNEVRISVEYCGINFADLYHVQGLLSGRQPPYVLGIECSGHVTEVGSSVNNVQVGDNVVCYFPECGLYRETVVVSSDHCFVVPPGIGNKVATALIANYLTAYFSLFHGTHLSSGQSLLIHSAAGGVGWAATQLAHTVDKVIVFGTASSVKHEEIFKNGVNYPLNPDTYLTDFNKTGYTGVDIIIDNIGGDNIAKSVDLLKPLGHLIITGANCVVTSDPDKANSALATVVNSNVDLKTLVVGNKSVSGIHLGTLQASSPELFKNAVEHIFTLCKQGKIAPRIDSVFEFEKAVDAMKVLSERRNIGKVLLKTKLAQM